MPQNLIEKIAQKHAFGLAAGQMVYSGNYISIKPAYVMTHDNTGAVIQKFKSIGAEKFKFPGQVVHTLDHNVQDKSDKNLEKYRKIEEFSLLMGAHFFPAGRGIGHQIMCEEGFAWPGTMTVASDSHSNMYGGLGCLGTPVVRTDAAAIWATGRTWWQVPPVVKIILEGRLPEGSTGKDLIIALCGHFNKDEVLNCALEFSGSGADNLSIDERLTIANMTTEWGALAGVFPIDSIVYKWIKERIEFYKEQNIFPHPRQNEERLTELKNENLKADSDALYSRIITVDLSSVQPHVCGPDTVKVMSPVSEISQRNVKIDKAYLVSCVNSRTSDIKQASEVLKNKKIAPDVKLYIAAASKEVQTECQEKGYWQTLIDAGATALPPGCGPCIGLGEGLLEDGETGISATNRNFKGRMGSPKAHAYLASPAVVAYSAMKGYIDFNCNDEQNWIKASITENENSKTISGEKVEILEGFPPRISGTLLFCYQDNLNTDGIYPGKYTYIDDFTPAQQAEVVMENYDPEFSRIAEKGDILAGGYNFGTGSSREQAATALKHKGIALVIAGSFNETYKRNALNNGFLLIEVPELIKDLKEKFGTGKLTLQTGTEAIVDFTKSCITADNKMYMFDSVGTAAQELIITGGLEEWVKNSLELNKPA